MLRSLAIATLALLTSHAAIAEKITIGVENINNLPHFSGESAQYEGFARELFDRFGQSYHHEITYKSLPIKRLYVEFFSGSVDFKYPDNPFWNKDGKKDRAIIYSQQPLEKTIDVSFVKTENMGKTDVKRLGTISGFSPWMYMDKITAGTVVASETKNFVQAATMLDLGRVDTVYYNLEAGNLLLKNQKLDSKISYDANLPKADADFYVSTLKHGKILTEFEDFMTKEAAWISALRSKHGVQGSN